LGKLINGPSGRIGDQCMNISLLTLCIILVYGVELP